MFHGIGSDAATASGTYYGWNALADQKQFVLFTRIQGMIWNLRILLTQTPASFYMTIMMFSNPGLSQYKRWDIANVLDLIKNPRHSFYRKHSFFPEIKL